MFEQLVKTEVVCKRIETENSLDRYDKFMKWLETVRDIDGVLGVVGWVEKDCNDDRRNYFRIWVFIDQSKIKPPIFYDGFGIDSDRKIVKWFNELVGMKLPVWFSLKIKFVSQWPDIDFKKKYMHCAIEESFAVWRFS